MRVVTAIITTFLFFTCMNDFPVRGDLIPIVGQWAISVDSRDSYVDTFTGSWSITDCSLDFNDTGTFDCYISIHFFYPSPQSGFIETATLTGKWLYDTVESFRYREGKKYYSLHARKMQLHYEVTLQRVGLEPRFMGQMEAEIVYTGYSSTSLELLAFIIPPGFSGAITYTPPLGVYTRIGTAASFP